MESLFGRKERKPGGALVLYTTKHGATQRYAERIAQPLDALVKEAAYAKIKKALSYDAIVLGCPVYAGKVKGLDFFAENIEALSGKRLALFTCGLYDPAEDAVRADLLAQIREKLGAHMDGVAIFHLRGGIRWQSLGLVERVMLKALIGDLKKKADLNETERLLIETEGGALDFSDECDVAEIVHAARFGKEETV